MNDDNNNFNEDIGGGGDDSAPKKPSPTSAASSARISSLSDSQNNDIGLYEIDHFQQDFAAVDDDPNNAIRVVDPNEDSNVNHQSGAGRGVVILPPDQGPFPPPPPPQNEIPPSIQRVLAPEAVQVRQPQAQRHQQQQFHAYPDPSTSPPPIVVSRTPPETFTITPLANNGDDISTVGSGTFGRGGGHGMGMMVSGPWWDDYDYHNNSPGAAGGVGAGGEGLPERPVTPRMSNHKSNTNVMMMLDDNIESGGDNSTLTTPPPGSIPPTPYFSEEEDDSEAILSAYRYYSRRARRRNMFCLALLCGIIILCVLAVLILSLVRIRRELNGLNGVVSSNDTDGGGGLSNVTDDNTTLYPALPPIWGDFGNFPSAETRYPSSPSTPTTPTPSPAIAVTSPSPSFSPSSFFGGNDDTIGGGGDYVPTVFEPTRMPSRPINQPVIVSQRPPTKQPIIVSSPTRTPTKSPVNPPPTRSPVNRPPTRAPNNPTPTRKPTRAPVQPSPTRKPTRPPTNPPPTRKPTRAPVRPSPTRKPTRPPTNPSPTRKPTRAPVNPPPTQDPTQSPVHPPTPSPVNPPPTPAPVTSTIAPAIIDSPAFIPPATPRNGGGFPKYPRDVRFQPWDELDEDSKHLYSTNLGYDEFTWNEPGSLWIEHKSFETLQGNASLPPALVDTIHYVMGFTEESWDCWINHYVDYHWFELSETQTSSGSAEDAFRALGWTKHKWGSTDRDEWPDSEFKCWLELTAKERSAAEELCYTKELWDKIPLPEWGQLRMARSDLKKLLKERSAEDDLDVKSWNPRSRAFEVVASDPDYFEYSEERVIQRYVLSLFAFGLRSKKEMEFQGIPTVIQSWTTTSDECTWFTPNPHDPVCNNDGMYQRIDLRDTNLYGTLPHELSLLSNSLSELYFLHLSSLRNG